MLSTPALTVIDARGDAAMRCWSEMVTTEWNTMQRDGNECNVMEAVWDVPGNILHAVLHA